MRSRLEVVLVALVVAAAVGGYFLLSEDARETQDLAEGGGTLQQSPDDATKHADDAESPPRQSAEAAAQGQGAADDETAERAPALETSDRQEPSSEAQTESASTSSGASEQPGSRVEPSQTTTETASDEGSDASPESDQVGASGQEDNAESADGASPQSEDSDTSGSAVAESAPEEPATAAEEGARQSEQAAETPREQTPEQGASDAAPGDRGAADETVVAALPKAPLPDEGEAPKAEPGPTPPSFDVVRIERDGALVAAGRSPRGSRVFLLRDGKVEAEAEADRRGNWVLILDRPLPPGDHELLLEARLPSGETIRSSELVVASVPGQGRPDGGQEGTGQAQGTEAAVAIAVPQEGGGARVLQGQDAEESEGLRTLGLSILSVDYDADGFIKVAGLGTPEATILAYLDNAPIGRTEVAADERWLIAPEKAVEEGLYQLRIDQLNEAGEVVARLETVFARTLFIADLPLERMVVVQPGNSLWRLARRLYGEGILYSVIYDANQDQIRDPDLIYPGQIFLAPRQLQAN